MVDQPWSDQDQSREIDDFVKNDVNSIKKYKNETMGSNIVNLLKHQHDKYEYIKDINVNIFDMSSKSRSGYSSNR